MGDRNSLRGNDGEARRALAQQELDALEVEHDLHLLQEERESLSSFAERMVEALGDKIIDLDEAIEQIKLMELDDEDDIG